MRAHHESVVLNHAFPAIEPLAPWTAHRRLPVGMDQAALVDKTPNLIQRCDHKVANCRTLPTRRTQNRSAGLCQPPRSRPAGCVVVARVVCGVIAQSGEGSSAGTFPWTAAMAGVIAARKTR